MPSDLFISYARYDDENGCVSHLVDRISRDFESFSGRSLRVFFDKNAIQGMDDWRQKIQQSLRESHLFLAVLSPSYMVSSYCRWEWEDYVRYEAMRQCLGEGVAPVFFVTLPDASDPKTDQAVAHWIKEVQTRQTFDLRPWRDAGENALQQAYVKSTLEQLQTSVRERLNRFERARRSPDNLIRHNPAFVGRVRELTELRSALVLNKLGVVGANDGQVLGRATVQGLGGMGKTELALAYAHAFAWDYPDGRWQIACEYVGDLRVALLQLAGPMNFEFIEDENKSLTLAFERVLRELNQRERCLLLLDNVSEPSILEPEYLDRLPRDGRVDLIATTRLAPRNIPGSAQTQTFIAVDELPQEDALALLRSHQPHGQFPNQEEDDDAREIVRLLEGFTLAVETAGIYLGRYVGEVTCAQFLGELRTRLLEHSEEAAGDATVVVRHRERLLEKTLAFTLETLSPEALHVLKLAALLPADSIAIPWLQSVGAEQFPAFNEDPEVLDSVFHQTAELLLGLRLFQTTGTTGTNGKPLLVRMHRLVQDLIRKHAPDEVASLKTTIAAKVNSRALFLLDGWMRHDHRWEIAAVVACAWQWMDRPDKQLAGSSLANYVVQPLLHLGNFAEAEPLMRRALEVRLQHVDQYDPRATASLFNLAAVLLETNHASEAEPLMRRALANCEQSFSADHPSLIDPLSSLASLLETTNRRAEAEPLRRRALAIAERSFGSDSQVVGVSLSNLGSLLLEDTTRYAEAESLMRRALGILEQALGPNHPDVAQSLNNLARLLQVTDRLAEAETLMQRALTIAEHCFGVDHPKLATRLNNLASLLANTNRLAEAESLLRRTLALDTQNHGPDHPRVADSLNNLASVLERMNRPDEAEPLIERGLRIREQSFGPYHPKVAESLDNLATLPQYANRASEAEPLLRRALAIREQSLGSDQPEIAASLNNLAVLLEAANRVVEAEGLMRRSLAIYEKNFGPDHPKVATVLTNLAGLLQATNKLEEAAWLRRRVVEIFLRVSNANGRPHEHLQSAIDRYAYSLKENGHNQEEVLAQLNAVGGPFGLRFGV